MHRRVIAAALAGAFAVGLFGTLPASAAAKATINVVHGIPGVEVNVCINGSEAIPDFKPGDVVSGVKLPTGSYDLKVVAKADTCGGTAILQANDVMLKGGMNYTIVADLKPGGTPNLSVFTNDVRRLHHEGRARLTVRHTADAPAVNVWANGSRLVGGTGFTFGDSATLTVPRGVYAAWVSLPGRIRPVIGPDVLRLRSGFAYQVYAWGDATGGYGLAVVATEVGVK
jgi:hypothetical protein